MFEFCESNGMKLPFSKSSLQKDRINGCLGGIPYRKIGRKVFYIPAEVLAFLDALPVCRSMGSVEKASFGTSTKVERVLASRKGLSVAELRGR